MPRKARSSTMSESVLHILHSARVGDLGEMRTRSAGVKPEPLAVWSACVSACIVRGRFGNLFFSSMVPVWFVACMDECCRLVCRSDCAEVAPMTTRVWVGQLPRVLRPSPNELRRAPTSTCIGIFAVVLRISQESCHHNHERISTGLEGNKTHAP